MHTVHILTSPDRIERSAPADRVWLKYAYRKHHPVLQYLPTKLAAEKGQLHVRPGRHPSPPRVLQHLQAHGPLRGRPYGSYGRAEAVRALTHALSLCGPRRQCAGARALDAPLTPRQLACIFFSPTKFTFSPISSLFRQVGSLFRQVGSLFRQVGSFRHIPPCAYIHITCEADGVSDEILVACLL